MLRRIVLLKPHEFLDKAWQQRTFAPAGVGLAHNISVRGQQFMEVLPPVPAFRRLPTGNEKVAAPIGVPRKPASVPAESFAVVAKFEDEEAIARFRRDKAAEVRGIFADPRIEAAPGYCQTSAVGQTTDVARLLGLGPLHARNLDGRGVRVAVVDTGIDGSHVGPNGKVLGDRIDSSRSYPGGYKPGSARRDHGTMVAYDISIAAPKATLLDYALLQAGAGSWEAFLSDAIAVYADLIDLLQRTPGPLVVNNSWALFDRATDAPVGSQENYSANPDHPFNQIVGALVTAGGDVVFAAGNCGGQCPDGRCGTNDIGPGASIHGANSHPAVITVAAVTTTRDRLGYSSEGPGDLAEKKPDLAGYSHFRGSGVYAADGGTSAAAPVVAGVVALLRQHFPSQSAAQMKGLLQSTADPLNAGWDYETGYGLVTTKAVSSPVSAPVQPSKKVRSTNPRFGKAWMLVETPAADPIVVKKKPSSKTAETATRLHGTASSKKAPARRKAPVRRKA
jgi:subtilisin family serine protease